MWGFRIFSARSEKQPRRRMRQSQVGTSPPCSRLLLPESGSTFWERIRLFCPCLHPAAPKEPGSSTSLPGFGVQLSLGEVLCTWCSRAECTELIPAWFSPVDSLEGELRTS